MTTGPVAREALAVVLAPAGPVLQPRESLPSHVEATLPPGDEDGREASYPWLGDLRLRFVYSRAGAPAVPATVADLKQLGTTPVQAFALACMNFRRDQGVPQVAALGDGVGVLRVPVPETAPSWLLHRALWRQRLGEGVPALLVAVPNRSTVLFVPASDPAAVRALERMAARLYRGSAAQRLSKCLLRFDAGGWHLAGQLPEQPEQQAMLPASSRPAGAADAESAADEAKDDLELAANGQRILVRTILLTFVAGALERSQAVAPLVAIAAYLAVAFYSLFGYVRICSGLGRSQNQKIFYMVTSFMPLVSVITMVYLSGVTTRRLRAAGWRVGLFGARP